MTRLIKNQNDSQSSYAGGRSLGCGVNSEPWYGKNRLLHRPLGCRYGSQGLQIIGRGQIPARASRNPAATAGGGAAPAAPVPVLMMIIIEVML